MKLKKNTMIIITGIFAIIFIIIVSNIFGYYSLFHSHELEQGAFIFLLFSTGIYMMINLYYIINTKSDNTDSLISLWIKLKKKKINDELKD